MAELLGRAGVDPKAAYVELKGPPGDYEKVERFPLAEARSDQVFLAYWVNGRDLPEKHGFPLRAVAEDHMGSVWVKFVQTVEAVIGAPSEANAKPGAGSGSGPSFLP
ncbi:MAG: molybdopterin-dependent oxidoreductase [Thermodesulfobacteriota bacterium]